MSRGDWLSFFQQVKYRRVIVVELEVPEAARDPQLAKALDFYQQAQSPTPQAITVGQPKHSPSARDSCWRGI